MMLGLAVVISAIVTLGTFAIDATPYLLVGATWHGWPFAWLYVIVYPGSPWSINWVNFAVDLALWFALSFVVLVSLLVLRKNTK
jgi:hypothetical protein